MSSRTTFGMYEAILGARSHQLPAGLRISALVSLIELPVDHPARPVLDRRAASAYDWRYDCSGEELALLAGTDPRVKALHALCSHRLSGAAKALEAVHGPERVLSTLLESVHDLAPGSLVHDLVVELATSSAPARELYVEGVMTNLAVLYDYGRPFTPALAGLYRSGRIPRSLSPELGFVACAAAEEHLSPLEEELYCTLVLDGVDCDEAARLAKVV